MEIVNIKKSVYKTVQIQRTKNSLEGISQKVLRENLEDMAAGGIIERIQYDEKILHTEYKLTSLGESMKPIMDALEAWSVSYKQSFISKV